MSCPAQAQWAGFYGGFSAGYYANEELPLDLTFGEDPPAAENGMFGAQVGYAWQRGPFVLGFEVDLSKQFGTERFSLSEEIAPDVTIDAATNRAQDWFSTFRVRMGVETAPNVLLFATGGLATGQVGASLVLSETDDSQCGCGGPGTVTFIEGNLSRVLVGTAFGGGFEVRTSPSTTMKFEYLHYDLGSTDMEMVSQFFGGNFTIPLENKGDLFRIGVNFALGAN